ncbi:transposase [Streptomyces sp. A3M-1-3]|uniref:transposase n=1 Tax=Streptomyces sp. A3M-1-3 TaxID=2962044 RepID=UPI0020B7D8F2|nr:transposase [Streptomyces sp. A3M-1-3]MCP3820443.1 transposase [Streptomyces sp. A3M-1-3]
MVNDTTLLLDLDGVSVIRVERLENGTRRVHLATADTSARACPVCGVFASRVKGAATTRPRDLPYGEHPLEFLWHKRRWWCREASCPRKSFTEQIPQIPAGARLTERLRCAAGRQVRDAGSTVVQAARDLGLSWPVVMDAFRTAAATVTEAPLPEVSVLGIDETRRGRTCWEQDPDTGKWQLTRDRWHTGFVDALGTGGLLGQVEGRTAADVLAWLSTTPLTWRKTIHHVAIDMSATYRAAIRTLLALARTGADREQVRHARWKFLTWCADSDIPEVRTLAATVDRLWPEIAAFIDTGHSNAKSEGINRVIKLVARNAFGFRNADSQRLRTRCVTTRRARGHLRTAQLRRPALRWAMRASLGPGADVAIHTEPEGPHPFQDLLAETCITVHNLPGQNT